MPDSTETREPRPAANERIDGCHPNKTTITHGERASHDRTASVCRAPTTPPSKGEGAEKMVMVGPAEFPFPNPNPLWVSLGILIGSFIEGKL